MIGGYFAALDTDKDGTLSKVEMTAAQSMMGGGRRRAPASAAAGATTTGGK
jgi:hypothetical protein